MAAVPRIDVLLLTTDPAKNTTHCNRELWRALRCSGAIVNYRCWGDISEEGICVFDCVVFLTINGYHKSIDAFKKFLDQLSSATKQMPALRVVNSVDIIQWNFDKKYLHELESAGFPIPDTEFIKAANVKSVKDALARRNGESIVVKPSVSASGDGTVLIRSPQALTYRDMEALEQVVQLSEGCYIMLQQYMSRISEGELSLVYVAGNFQYAILKKPPPDDFRTNYGSFEKLESKIPDNTLKLGNRVCEWLVSRFPPDGSGAHQIFYARIDVVEAADDDYKLIEVELIEPCLGFDRGKEALNILCAEITRS